MSGMVNVPGVGPAKKGYVLLGIAAVGGIVGLSYLRRKNAAAAAAATPVDTTTAGQTSNPYSLASDASGYNTAYPSGYNQQPYSQYGYDIYGNPLPAPTGLNTTGGAYTTNNDWATAAETVLQNTGITLEVAATAVTRVLGGLSVTSVQQGYFLQAVGTLGQPPQGYTKPIHVVDPPPKPTGSTAPHKPGNLHTTRITRNEIDVSWNAVSGADSYSVYRDGHLTTQVVQPGAMLTGLRPNTTHTIGVKTRKGGVLSHDEATIHTRTKK